MFKIPIYLKPLARLASLIHYFVFGLLLNTANNGEIVVSSEKYVLLIKLLKYVRRTRFRKFAVVARVCKVAYFNLVKEFSCTEAPPGFAT